ncbi:MAG: nuclear transport factor 2 family protein [Ferruginibacter sp.]
MLHTETIALQWLAAFNAHDLEALLSLYDDDALHYSPKLKLRMPETNGYIRGKEALRTWWADAFERLPGLQYVLTSVTADERSVFMEYTRKLPGEADMMVAEVLEIDKKIAASRVYHG